VELESGHVSHRRQRLPEVDRRRGRTGLRRLVRFPEMVRSLIIGYVWDSTARVGTICKSQKTPTIVYLVLRSGPGELGKWITERRNVVEDFRRIYGGIPENPSAVSLSIDSDDTSSSAESFIGPIAFTRR
jgi:Protein of unknown function (DUF3047)